MAVSIEDILLARAAADEASRPTTEQVATAGAIGGSLLGVAAGSVPHAGSELVGSARRLLGRTVGGDGQKSIMQREPSLAIEWLVVWLEPSLAVLLELVLVKL